MTGRRTHGAWAAATLAGLVFALSPARAQAPVGYRVIVNVENPGTEIDRAFLARAFLKKITRWPNGLLIRPVDHDPDSAVRREFSEDVLGRTSSAVRNSWQQAIFDGRDVPPPELDSDAAVVEFVARYPGAIGYVSRQANVSNVRVLVVR